MLIDVCPVIRQIFETGFTEAADGERIAIHSHLPPAFAEGLYQTVVRERPAVCLEIGMACGTSTLAILSALKETGSGKLISIDPFQRTDYQGSGLRAIQKAGLVERHELIEQVDYFALPELLKSGAKIDFAYIDGWHTFDYALLDWWYVDRMLNTGGIVAFNDCSWPAIDKVLAFVTSHRKYTEIDSGIKKDEEWLSRKTKILDWLLMRPKRRLRQVQDRYFRKTEHWEPRWDFFAEF